MKIKNISSFAQKKLTHTLSGQLHRARPIAGTGRDGGCWPQSGGQEKTIMWQSPGWPASGKNIPRAAQKRSIRFLTAPPTFSAGNFLRLFIRLNVTRRVLL